MSRVGGFVIEEEEVELEGWAGDADGVRWRTLLSGDRTPSGSLTLGVAVLEPGVAGRPHRHAQPEAYYVLAGSGVVEIDGREHPVKTGSAAFLPGGATHAARNTGRETLRILYVFPADSFAEIEYTFSP